MNLKRRPNLRIEIIRPNYDALVYSSSSVVSFVPTKKLYNKKESNDLIFYNFEKSLHTHQSTFSFGTTLRIDSNNKTWYDKIRKMDLVFISEFGEKRFCGVIKDKRYSAAIGSDGKPQRSISFSGVSVGALLSSFPLVLDQYLYESTTTAKAASTKLIGILATLQKSENIQVSNILKEIYKAYFELAQSIGGLGTSQGIKGVIDEFVVLDSNLSSDVVARYPMSFSLYQVGENSIWDIISQFVTPPINELFGMWNPGRDKYEIIFRQAPFENYDWKKLKSNLIPPEIITKYDLGSSDSEVFTFYMGLLPGSGISRNKAMVYDSGAGRIPQIDKEKWKKYGYKPLIVDFRYFDRSKESTFGAANLMSELSIMMKKWFGHNDEFLSGTINIMTIGEGLYPNARDPRIGEKAQFLEGEFYIEGTSHSWSMGGAMNTTLKVTRGYGYNMNGSPNKFIDAIGQKIRSILRRV